MSADLIAFAAVITALVGAVTAFVTLRKVNVVHVQLNGKSDNQNKRLFQLESALRQAGIEVPDDPALEG